MKPIEAKSENTPMIATTCELRGIDFQNPALVSRTRELVFCFGIAFPLDSGTHNLTCPAGGPGNTSLNEKTDQGGAWPGQCEEAKGVPRSSAA